MGSIQNGGSREAESLFKEIAWNLQNVEVKESECRHQQS